MPDRLESRSLTEHIELFGRRRRWRIARKCPTKFGSNPVWHLYCITIPTPMISGFRGCLGNEMKLPLETSDLER
jgi:hypothetical protein